MQLKGMNIDIVCIGYDGDSLLML